MAGRWFRYYEEALNDPKVQMLSGDNFKAWVNLLCLASQNGGELPNLDAVAFALRLSKSKAASLVIELATAELLDAIPGRYYAPHNWGNRQYKSDVSNDRVKQFRERRRNGGCNVTSNENETPPEPDQNQRTEKKDSFVGKAGKANGYSPPRNGAFMARKGLVYFHKGTAEWDAHAADFRGVHGCDPDPDRGGGYWFKMRGEAAA